MEKDLKLVNKNIPIWNVTWGILVAGGLRLLVRICTCRPWYLNSETENLCGYLLALDWFSSRLSQKSFVVASSNFISSSAPLSCGVPQGLVLGPPLYRLPLGHILNNSGGIAYHCFANDTQLYMSFKVHEVSKWSVLQDGIHAIKNWMAANYPPLNTQETEGIWLFDLCPDNFVPTITQNLGPVSCSVCHTVRNLGVILIRCSLWRRTLVVLYKLVFIISAAVLICISKWNGYKCIFFIAPRLL